MFNNSDKQKNGSNRLAKYTNRRELELDNCQSEIQKKRGGVPSSLLFILLVDTPIG